MATSGRLMSKSGEFMVPIITLGGNIQVGYLVVLAMKGVVLDARGFIDNIILCCP